MLGICLLSVALFNYSWLSEFAHGMIILSFVIMYCGWKVKRSSLFPEESWRLTPFPLISKEFPELTYWAIRSYVWFAITLLAFWGSYLLC